MALLLEQPGVGSAHAPCPERPIPHRHPAIMRIQERGIVMGLSPETPVPTGPTAFGNCGRRLVFGCGGIGSGPAAELAAGPRPDALAPPAVRGVPRPGRPAQALAQRGGSNRLMTPAWSGFALASSRSAPRWRTGDQHRRPVASKRLQPEEETPAGQVNAIGPLEQAVCRQMPTGPCCWQRRSSRC